MYGACRIYSKCLWQHPTHQALNMPAGRRPKALWWGGSFRKLPAVTTKISIRSGEIALKIYDFNLQFACSAASKATNACTRPTTSVSLFSFSYIGLRSWSLEPRSRRVKSVAIEDHERPLLLCAAGIQLSGRTPSCVEPPRQLGTNFYPAAFRLDHVAMLFHLSNPPS